jgi:hypothetical protein
MSQTVRRHLSIALVVLLLAGPFTLAQQAEKAPPRKLPTVKQLRDALNCNFMFGESVNVPLPQALKFFEDHAADKGKYLVIHLDSAAIKKANESTPDIETVNVRLTKTEHPVLLKVALQSVLNQFESTNNEGRLAFAIVEGRVLIGPPRTLRETVLTQPVSIEAESVPLRTILKQLSDRTGVNLVLDPRLKEEPKATVEVHEMALTTAVSLLAEMSDLNVVRLPDDGFFLTTKERGDRIRKEQKEGLFPAERPARKEVQVSTAVG